jgi:hypothetical protein
MNTDNVRVCDPDLHMRGHVKEREGMNNKESPQQDVDGALTIKGEEDAESDKAEKRGFW